MTLAVEVDLEIEQPAIVGLERRGGVVVAHKHLPHDLDVAAATCPGFRGRRPGCASTNGRRAAIDDRAFGAGHGQQRVVDAKAAESAEITCSTVATETLSPRSMRRAEASYGVTRAKCTATGPTIVPFSSLR